mgnify:CR=1 FL=1
MPSSVTHSYFAEDIYNKSKIKYNAKAPSIFFAIFKELTSLNKSVMLHYTLYKYIWEIALINI